MCNTGHNRSYYPAKKKNPKKISTLSNKKKKGPQTWFEYDYGCNESNSFQHFYYNQRH